MKRLAILFLVCTSVLVPARARANDGGWYDWLFKWDAKLMGVSTDIHLACLNQNGDVIYGCEEWFRNFIRLNKIEHTMRVLDPTKAVAVKVEGFSEIKHEFDLRVGYLRNYGARYDTDKSGGEEIKGAINAVKLIAIYHNHLTEDVAVGGGVGYMPVWGERFGTLSRVILTVDAVIRPSRRVKAFLVRPEFNFIPQGFDAAEFGDDPTKVSYSRKPEWNFAIGFGFDLRRIGTYQ
jgi:hypothetical protein